MNKEKNGQLERIPGIAQSPATSSINALYSHPAVVEEIGLKQRAQLKESLVKSGLQLMSNKSNVLAEKICHVITEMIYNSDELPEVNYSDYISEKLHRNYTYLANVFSKVMGTTIQQYIIIQKIEKMKKLLQYDNINLKEISFRLHYSSAAHMSNQFKKITGITPSFYMQMKQTERACLKNLGYL